MFGLATLANASWCLSGYQDWRRFRKHAEDPEATQQMILNRLITTNQETEFGKNFGFKRIKNYTDFKALVPLQGYEDFQTDILRIARGEDQVLTKGPVTLLEPSGGSSGGVKYIPYTQDLAQEFKRGIQAWIFDLFSSIPALLNGPAYWSISPANELPVIEGAQIPIGFNDDSEYLSKFGQGLMNHILAVPGFVSQIRDMEAFRYVTLFYLLKAHDLRLISIWNPTFLSLLLDELPKHWDALLVDIKKGSIRELPGFPDALLTQINRTLKADGKRAKQLRGIGPGDLTLIWPKLRLISCWMDGTANHYAKRLEQDYFPGVEFQGKGLLATEAFVSFPLHDGFDPVLSIDSHFYEFLALDASGVSLEEEPLPAHKLEQGQRYSVVVTTGGGLYRYRLNDIIEVTGFFQNTPRFRFRGKTEHYSDLFGEKLTETFVADCLNETIAVMDLEPAFMLITPEENTPTPHYCLYFEHESLAENVILDLASRVDLRLRKNYHYDYCRHLGQLGSLTVTHISRGSAIKYLEFRQQRGQKLGDIKPSLLDSSSGWGDLFKGAN